MRLLLLTIGWVLLASCSTPKNSELPVQPASTDHVITTPAGPGIKNEQAVIVRIPLGASFPNSSNPVWSTEEKVTKAIESAGVGEYDGNEVGGGEFVMYAYGPDAEKLSQAVTSALKDSHLPSKIKVTKRFGPPGARESTEVIPEWNPRR